MIACVGLAIRRSDNLYQRRYRSPQQHDSM
jgi:hypothetical protein